MKSALSAFSRYSSTTNFAEECWTFETFTHNLHFLSLSPCDRGGYGHGFSLSRPQDFLPQLIKADRDRLYGADLSSGSSSGGRGAALWVGGAPSGGKSWANRGGSKSPGSTFNLTATMRFPSQPVTYVPGISEVLLQAWMPYLALALVVGWLLDRCFLGFVFRHRLVDCLEQSECPPLVPGAKSAWGQPRLKAY
jgi:hypothetical protein